MYEESSAMILRHSWKLVCRWRPVVVGRTTNEATMYYAGVDVRPILNVSIGSQCFWIRFRCPYLARYRLGVWSFWCLEHDSIAGLFCTRIAVDSVWCQMVESYSNRSWREDQAACKAANVCAKSLSRGSVCDGSTVQDSCMIAPRPTRVADSELSITPSSLRVYRQVDSGDVKRLYVGWQQFLCLGFVRIQLQAVLHVPLSDVSAYTQRELTVQRLCCRSASQDEAECRQSSPYYETVVTVHCGLKLWSFCSTEVDTAWTLNVTA